MVKKKLLIIDKEQFGYHIDSYQYCRYLKNEFDITYICFDTKQEKIDANGINVVYIAHEGSFFRKGIKFLKTSRQHIEKNRYDVIFIVYFQTASLLRLMFPSKNFIMNICTGAVWYGSAKRKIDNMIIRFECMFFQHISVISSCLRDKLKIKKRKTHILPLGADPIAMNKKQYHNLNLLYIGNFDNRNLYETIYGLKKFLDNNLIEVDVTYDIVGFGYDPEVKKIMDAIDETKLYDIVTLNGIVTHNELKPFLEKCNIGICYIPVTDYFNCQPSTKLFEYINSGLICIATNTHENRAYINNDNGLLCADNFSAFAKTLEKLNNKKREYDTEKIKKTLKKHTWSNIVNNNLKPYLNETINGKS
jgi:hypothetical protein